MTTKFIMQATISTKYFDLYRNFFSDEEAKTIFEKLMEELKFERHNLKIRGKVIPEPRLNTFHTDAEPEYGYSGAQQENKKITPTLNQLLKVMRVHFDEKFDSVLCNLYQNGKEYIGYHADREARETVVASLSLGATRKFRMRKIKETRGWDYEWDLNAGDLIIMKVGCQSKYKHTVPKQLRVTKPRLNLTFRVMAGYKK